MGARVMVRLGHCRLGKSTGGKGRNLETGADCMCEKKLRLEREQDKNTPDKTGGPPKAKRTTGRYAASQRSCADVSRSRALAEIRIKRVGCNDTTTGKSRGGIAGRNRVE